MDVLRSMLFKEVLKVAGSAALMSRGSVSASNVRSLNLLSLVVCKAVSGDGTSASTRLLSGWVGCRMPVPRQGECPAVPTGGAVAAGRGLAQAN